MARKREIAEIFPKELSLKFVEMNHIVKVLRMYDCNRYRTARALGISQKTLYLKIREYKIVLFKDKSVNLTDNLS